VKLNDNEIISKTNVETGEIKDIYKRPNNLAKARVEQFKPKSIFTKQYTVAWNYLEKVLSTAEYKMAHRMCVMAKMNTNSLEPLNDNTAMIELSEYFNVSRNHVKHMLDNLFKHGVFAKFELVKEDCEYTKYWILNPFLSFSGNVIKSDIAELFVGTKIERLVNEYL
jgi:putative ribosome biogenesis GTPase RsgA